MNAVHPHPIPPPSKGEGIRRLKLPAYGKALLARRRAGEEVLEAALIYGRDWQRAIIGDPPFVALIPEHYEPGHYDFRVLAGLRVTVHDQAFGAWEFERPAKYGKFYALLRELTAGDAYVTIRWPGCTPAEMDADDLAFICRYFDSPISGWCWPPWWCEDLHLQQRRRAALWFADRGRELIERECGRA